MSTAIYASTYNVSGMEHITDFEGDGELLLDGERLLGVHYVLRYCQEVLRRPGRLPAAGRASLSGLLTCEDPGETFSFLADSCDVQELQLRMTDGTKLKVLTLDSSGNIELAFLGF